MAYEPQIQITFDCASPHELVVFWAEALNYEVEDNSARVLPLLEAGILPEAATCPVNEKPQFADVAACSDRNQRRPRLLFQRVPEAKVAKNRVHLDIRIEGNLEFEMERLMKLGATEAWRSNDRGVLCVTMRDPEGNELCLS